MKLLKGSVLLLLLFAVTNISAQEITEKVKKKFDRIDNDKNGSVELAEMNVFKKHKTNKNGQLKGEMFFFGLDKNEDNKVTIEEFAMKPNWKLAREKAKAKAKAKKEK